MANKDLNEMGLPKSITNIFTTRNLLTAKALSLLEQCTQNEYFSGHLPTRLKGLDEVLCGGIPFGVLTKLVGPAGIGKTQIKNVSGPCFSDITYFRMIEIGVSSFPDIFHMEGMAQEMAGRILVLQPSSLAEFTESLQQIKVSLLQHQVKLLVIDSMTALVSGPQ